MLYTCDLETSLLVRYYYCYFAGIKEEPRRDEQPRCGHVELRRDAVGDEHAGGALRRPQPHGGRHEDRHRGAAAGHQPRGEPSHGQAHQDLHERGPGQEADLRPDHPHPREDEEVTTNLSNNVLNNS